MDTPEQGYPISELAEAFRDPTPQEYETLKENIQQHGQQVPIALKDGKIVDGRQRERICHELGITPRYEKLPDGVDPARFLMAMHRKYRNLSKNDLALAAWKLSLWSRPGGDRKSEDYQRDHSAQVRNDLTQQEAARSLGVSSRLVSQASRLLGEDSPLIRELQEAVETGEVMIGDAYRVKDQPAEVQGQALNRFRSEKDLTITATVKAIVANQPESNSTPQPAGAYRTVVVDPVWPAGDPGQAARTNGQDTALAAMTVDEIAQMELPLADDAFVFLWATQEHLPDALKVLERWGLRYKFTMVWQKGGGGRPANLLGHDVEFIVVGVMGEPKLISNMRFSSVISSPYENPPASHSAKPTAFYNLLSGVTPGPRLELPEDCVKHWAVWREQTRDHRP